MKTLFYGLTLLSFAVIPAHADDAKGMGDMLETTAAIGSAGTILSTHVPNMGAQADLNDARGNYAQAEMNHERFSAEAQQFVDNDPKVRELKYQWDKAENGAETARLNMESEQANLQKFITEYKTKNGVDIRSLSLPERQLIPEYRRLDDLIARHYGDYERDREIMREHGKYIEVESPLRDRYSGAQVAAYEQWGKKNPEKRRAINGFGRDWRSLEKDVAAKKRNIVLRRVLGWAALSTAAGVGAYRYFSADDPAIISSGKYSKSAPSQASGYKEDAVSVLANDAR